MQGLDRRQRPGSAAAAPTSAPPPSAQAASAAKRSKYRGAQGLDPKFIKELEKQFGFDKPAYERFWLMIRNYAVFDFGQSYFRDVPVLQLIGEKLPVSISLGLWMTLLSYAISIPLGIAKAVRDGSRFDVWTSGVVIIGYAIPSFLFAILLIILFAGGSFCQIFPAARPHLRQLGGPRPGRHKIADYLWHITLPVIAMSLGAFATSTFLTKNSFLDEIRKQYVQTARMKGLAERRRALRPRVPQRHDDRRGGLSRAPSSAPSSPARC